VRLSKTVIGNPEAIRKLETIVHPLVGLAQLNFLKTNAERGTPMVVLDIPLLLESKGPKRVDVIVVVSAPADMQRTRVLSRPGMTAEKLDIILQKQMPDAEKRVRADYIIDTSQGLAHAEAQVAALIEKLRGQPGQIWKAQNA
jgi:dephospho-CoA kinase